MTVLQNKSYTNSFAGGSLQDSILYIPLVLQDSTTVNGFIGATLQDSIGLSYYLSKDYKAYPLIKNDSVMSKDDYALLVMKLNQLTFGYSQFVTTDHSLFTAITNLSSNVPTYVQFQSDTATNLHASQQGQTNSILYCESVVISACISRTNSLQQYQSSNIAFTSCPTFTTTTCWNSSLPTSGGEGTGIETGGTGGGGGGGSASGIPYIYPCLATGQNPLLSNTVIPNCPPPGGGTGWVPFVFQPYICNYQLTPHEQDVFNQLDGEDNQTDQNHQNLDCQGTKRTGNIFFKGTKEHWMIQLDYVSKNPVFGEVEFAIPNSSPVGNRGYADIVNLQNKGIFEIKPDNQLGQQSGATEVANYVAKANQFCGSTLPMGVPWSQGVNYTPTILPTKTPNRYLKTRLHAAGVIVYNYEDIPNPSPAPPIVVPASVAQKFKYLADRLRLNFDKADEIIAEYLQQNPDLVTYIKGAAVGAGVAIIVGTIIEDFLTLGAGLADDWACFVLSHRIIRFAIAL